MGYNVLMRKRKYPRKSMPADIFKGHFGHMALFGKPAKQWRDENPDDKGNIRDYADMSQLVCLSNLENLNAHFISDGMVQSERLIKLNQIAIHQMKLLTTDSSVKRIEDK